MRTNARDSEPTLRGEIEYLLQNREPDFERGCCVGTAWTAEAIAEELRADLEDVKNELRELRKEGIVMIRITRRSGYVLWKLTDDLHERWQAFAGPGANLGWQGGF